MDTARGSYRLPDVYKMEMALMHAGRNLKGAARFKDIELEEVAKFDQALAQFVVPDISALLRALSAHSEREQFCAIVAHEIGMLCSYAAKVPQAHIYMAEEPEITASYGRKQFLFYFSAVEHVADGEDRLLYNGAIVVDDDGVSTHH